MNTNGNSIALITAAFFGICSGIGFIHFISKKHNVPRAMKYRLVGRRVCLILLLVFAAVGITTPSGSIWERGTFDAMLFFAFAYIAFPFYTLAKLLANGIRAKMARGSQPQ